MYVTISASKCVYLTARSNEIKKQPITFEKAVRAYHNISSVMKRGLWIPYALRFQSNDRLAHMLNDRNVIFARKVAIPMLLQSAPFANRFGTDTGTCVKYFIKSPEFQGHGIAKPVTVSLLRIENRIATPKSKMGYTQNRAASCILVSPIKIAWSCRTHAGWVSYPFPYFFPPDGQSEWKDFQFQLHVLRGNWIR